MASLLPSFLRRSSATTNPYTSLSTSSSSSSNLDLETKPTRLSSSARANPKTLVVAFLGAQLVLICLAAVLFDGGPPRLRAPHEHAVDANEGAGAYKWGGFDEVCQGEFGKYVCGEYGPHNVKLSRSYEGTGTRFREVFRRVQQQGTPLRVALLGGSVSGGHGIGDKGSDELWIKRTFDAMNESYPHPGNSLRNAAVGAVGSDYFGACWENLIKKDEVDIIFVEHGINDLFEHASGLYMEDLLRGLLDLPQRPAVLVVRTIGFEGEMIAVGGDEHLPVATYYDVPVISLRPVLLPLLLKEPERIEEYFVFDGSGNVDKRHINGKGHHALGDFIGSYVLDQQIVARHQLADLRTSGHQDWTQLFGKQREGEHDWPGPDGLGDVPRLRLFQRYDPSFISVPMKTQCLTMDQGEFVTNPLLPSLRNNTGWSQMTPESTPDKTYLWASTPGARFSVDLEVTGGKVEIYFLRAGDEAYRLGSVDCWVDGDEEMDGVGRERSKRFDGWWDEGMPHIGQFGVVATGLGHGRRTLTCEVMEETANPQGGTEFRIISVVAL